MELMKSLNFVEVYNMLGGITDWGEAGYPVVKTEMPPTTTTPPTTTAPLTPLDCGLQVLEIVLPEAGSIEGLEEFSIFIVVTNPRTSQVSCDIPIILTQVEDPTFSITYTISATLNAGETKLVSFDEASLPKANYEVQVGNMLRPLLVG